MKQVDLNTIADQDLASLIQAGNDGAFAELHRRFFHKMLAFALRWLDDEAAAQDAVQESYILLWEKKEKINPERSLTGLLFKVLRYQVLTTVRQDKKRQGHLDDFALFMDTGTAEADERLREQELENIIQQAVDSMPEKMREIFILSRRHQLSYKEIADQLGISEHTVKKQVSRALQRQRDYLDKLFPAVLILLEWLRG